MKGYYSTEGVPAVGIGPMYDLIVWLPSVRQDWRIYWTIALLLRFRDWSCLKTMTTVSNTVVEFLSYHSCAVWDVVTVGQSQIALN